MNACGLLVLALTLFPAVVSHAQKQASVRAPVWTPLEKTVTFVGGNVLHISHDSKTNASVITTGETRWSFPSSQQICQVEMNTGRNVALLLVQRFNRKTASYYVGILCVREDETGLAFSWHLTDDEMVRIDGRRRYVLEILSVEQFPKVSLRVNTYKQPDGATGTETKEELWDLLKRPLEVR